MEAHPAQVFPCTVSQNVPKALLKRVLLTFQHPWVSEAELLGPKPHRQGPVLSTETLYPKLMAHEVTCQAL